MNSQKAPSFLYLTMHEWALVGVTMLWGSTFLIIQIAMQYCGPLFFVGFRFVAAGMITSLVFWRSLKGLTRYEVMAGTAIGITIFLGYSLQTAGLKTIPSSLSAFITALYVPLVPILQWLIMRKAPRLTSWIGALFAFVGLVLLAGPDAFQLSFSSGEMLTIISTLAIALEIILISLFSNQVDSRRVTIVQVYAAGIFSFIAMGLSGEALPAFSPVWLIAALSLATMSALIQLTMNWAQKKVSPTRATIIYTGEPVWAGIFGRFAGERLAPLAIFGALLILLGIIVSELKLSLFKKRRKDEL